MPISVMYYYCIDVRTLRSWLLLRSFSVVLTASRNITNATNLRYGAYRVSR